MSANLSLPDLTEPDRQLVEAARAAAGSAYAPYSGFAVGAALRSLSGRLHIGANLENASYGLGICAEVAALAAANTAGDFAVAAIAVSGRKVSAIDLPGPVVTPCGRCRQLIIEAAHVSSVDIRVLACNGDLSMIVEAPISTLLPAAFGPASLSVPPPRSEGSGD